MKISIFRKSDVGLVRTKNEDNYAIIRGKISETATSVDMVSWNRLSLRGEGVFVSAIDGMGGSAGGQMASEGIAKFIIDHWNEIKIEKPIKLPVVALEKANVYLHNLALANPEFSKMGAVATCCYFYGKSAYGAQVGDSRLYLFRSDELSQISEDQTFVSNLARMGKITPKEAETHPKRNVVSQALGPGVSVKPVDFKLKIKAGDKVLLCSDGLHGLVSSKEIQNILSLNHGQDSVDKLVNLANQLGGTDNITVIIAEILD
ncbi:serine/threonine-protein phosphatase [Leptospira ognonensis]|uniref:Serine/threonine-protein phosphatase n=1 Tax=Leptospira ognonensis TaxID=2484945 RepID=A0A4R9KBS8_9LEPT|nr:protein phosphatase 2C domain-containing protein [Leptospira ognonensis]TGL62293.1 serine/threonine-protein phosphatase [Leptospira ognonensis]